MTDFLLEKSLFQKYDFEKNKKLSEKFMKMREILELEKWWKGRNNKEEKKKKKRERADNTHESYKSW